MTLSRGQLIAAGVVVLLLLALVVRACGGSEELTPPPVAEQPTTTVQAPVQDTGEVTRVPGGRAPSAGANDGRPVPSRTPVPRDRISTLPGGVDAVAEQVDWLDRRQVASRTVRAAEIIATLYGREISPTVAALRPMMNRQALLTVQSTMSIDPPPASVKPARVRIIAANLRTDPETGIRTADVQVQYPDAPDNQVNALVTMQFAASAPTIVGWEIQPD